MKKRRIIPRIDVKSQKVVKGVHLEGLKIVGNPAEIAKELYDQGADELIYIDIVASLYGRNSLLPIIEEATQLGVFIPLTVGGGIRTVDDIKRVLRAGADKVAINTQATKRPEFITEAAKIFGSQCIVGSIEAKRTGGAWKVFTDNGREPTGLDVIEWARKLVELGCGELLITSIDKEGTKQGFDTELIRAVSTAVPVPVIACGGASSEKSVADCFKDTDCDAVALSSILYDRSATISTIKQSMAQNNLPTRIGIAEERPVQNTGLIVSVIDYGLGNLKSVVTAFRICGSVVRVITTPEEIKDSEFLVLPGVGAFGDGMKGLADRNLVSAIKAYAESGRPLLGICLGQQLLMDSSLEFGFHKGLGLIQGEVVPLRTPTEEDPASYRVPHVGWNSLERPAELSWSGTLLDGIPEGSEMYFVHSFCVKPKGQQNSLANVSYGGQVFSAVSQLGNVIGTQFHPEKSGVVGLDIIKQLTTMQFPHHGWNTKTMNG